MKKRQLGSLDFQVSPVSFGGAGISSEGRGYSFGYISEADAITLLRRAHDRGINLFDTAPIYGHGVSEVRIGKAFKDIREQVFIVCKSGVTWDGNKQIIRTNDPEVTQRMLEQSLRDLRTDYIDLFMLHWPDPEVDIRIPTEVLRKAQDQGKILHIGLCNTHVEDLEKAQEVAHIVAVQSQFSLFETGAIEALFPYLKKQRIGFMSWGTLDRGIVTGRVTRDRIYDEYDSRRGAPWWKEDVVKRKLEAMEEIETILEGHSGLELALGVVLQNPEVSTALCGIRSEEQLDSVIAASQNLPETGLLDRARTIALRHVPPEPYW